MTTRLNPYISFKNSAKEAMEFYQSVLGGKLDMNTFKEFNSSEDPSEDDLIMHAMLVTDGGLVLMGADTPMRMQYDAGARISISLSGPDKDELQGYFDKLSEGGKVTVPLEKAMWGDWFGMLVDKYDINWMINIEGPKE